MSKGRKLKSKQLKFIIENYTSSQKIDIDAIVLDYISLTGSDLVEVLKLKHEVYEQIFHDDASALLLLKTLISIKGVDYIEYLRKQSRESFPLINNYLNKIYSSDEFLGAKKHNFLDQNDVTHLASGSDAIIWQLSDIHFGIYNLLDNQPCELATLFGFILDEHPSLKPDIIIVSGDLSSVAEKDEFKKFNEFLTHLSDIIWGESKPQRILVVPGNHDTKWIANGTADKLKTFQEIIVKEGKCTTPFGKGKEICENGNIIIKRSPSKDKVPPAAVVEFKKLNLEILLIVSCYYSYIIPSEVRNILKKRKVKNNLQEDIIKLLRLDKGEITREYLLQMVKLLTKSNNFKIGVTHHNLVSYGEEINLNKFAQQMLTKLYKNDIHIILHGHVHLMEDSPPERPVMKGHAYPLPCPTLTSFPHSGERGFNIHFFKKNGDTQNFQTLVWPLHQESSFEISKIYSRYSITTGPGKIQEVKHC